MKATQGNYSEDALVGHPAIALFGELDITIAEGDGA